MDAPRPLTHEQQAILETAAQLRREILQRVIHYLNTYLGTPHLVNQINIGELSSGVLDYRNRDALAHHFWRQIQVFEALSALQLGTERGEYVGIVKLEDGTPTLELKDPEAGPDKSVFALTEWGDRTDRCLGFAKNYDPRPRHWYQQAKISRRSGWSEIYQYSTNAAVQLGIMAVAPVYEGHRSLPYSRNPPFQRLSSQNSSSQNSSSQHLSSQCLSFQLLPSQYLSSQGQDPQPPDSQLLDSQPPDSQPPDSQPLSIAEHQSGNSEIGIEPAFIGVLGTDFALSHISYFLSTLQIGPSGVIFIMERSGCLIASSTPEPVFLIQGDKAIRLQAPDSSQPLIAATGQYLFKRFGQLQQIGHLYQLQFEQEDQIHLLDIQPFQDQYGLDWLIVMVIPEVNFIQRLSTFHQRSVSEAYSNLQQINQALEAQVEQRTLALKRSADALRQSEERWQLAVQGSSDGIWDWNLQTDEIFFSARWKEISGYGEYEVSNQFNEWKRRIHPEDVDRVLATLQAHLHQETEFYSAEYRTLCKNGSYKWVLDRGQSLWNERGEAIRISGSRTDISARKQAELDLLRAKEAAEAASRAKTTFLNNMSHELRTPLNAIMGFTQLLGFDLELDPEHQDYIQGILTSSTHLLTLIERILEMSRLELGNLTLEETCFDLQELLNSLQSRFILEAEAKGLTFTIAPTSPLPSPVIADQGKLLRALSYLIENGIKFTDTGKITVLVHYQANSAPSGDYFQAGNDSLGNPPISPSLKSGLLQFEIIDTGVGIPLNQLERIFDAFEQADRGHFVSTGTGLGLTLSREFVKIMGGDLAVRSTPGQGSVFSLKVPV